MLGTRGYLLFLTFFAGFLAAHAEQGRSYIQAVGSSAIYPFAIAVAESFHLKTAFPTPIIESTGTGGGIKIFCSGHNKNTPDLVLASRPMRAQERQYCDAQGVTSILEITLGHDGIVVASCPFKMPFSLTRKQLYLALVSSIEGYPNRNFYWSDITPKLPRQKIRILGPSVASGTREAFSQFIMRNHSSRFRHDDVYVEVSDQETVIVQKLQLEPDALGVFSFSFLMLNSDKVVPFPIEGVIPTFETITSGVYPLSRLLYLYVKKDRLKTTSGLASFIKEFISADAAGQGGYLTFYGFIPQREEKRLEEEKKVLAALKETSF
jgi:phosphate transport system substrate-binding protein